MNYFAAEQERDEWCWAACIQMVLSTRGIHESQEDIVRHAFGAVDDAPGDPVTILSALDGWQIQREGRPMRLSATLGMGGPSLEVLINSLESQVPVMLAIKPDGSDVGHAVVVTAVIYETGSDGAHIDSIIVRDPWPSLRASEGKRRLTPAEYSSIIYFLRVSELETPTGKL